ncbi:MAG TPA: TasA family protein [Gaiellaceae bacterium]|nr:TasA family protein [Gaiellaceae bacterium]
MFKQFTLKKVLLSLAAISLVSVAAFGGTFANFTATPTSISSNAFTAGSLTMTRSGSGAIFSAATMKIGDTATGSVTITNTGNLAGAYTLAGSNSGSAALAGQLTLKIYEDTDNTGTVVYNGTLGGFSSASLGTFAANGGAHTFYFHVSLPSTGSDTSDNAFQGLTSTETFTWSATQA